MRKPLFAILQYVIFLGAGIFLVWWSIHKLSDKDYAEFIMALKTANYYLLIPVFFILIAIHLQPDLQRAHLFDAGTGQRLTA